MNHSIENTAQMIYRQDHLAHAQIPAETLEAIATFRKTLAGPHTNVWSRKFHSTLHFIGLHPLAGPEIGLIPCENGGFLVHADRCAAFFGITRSGVNHDLQQHGFLVDHECNISAELSRFGQALLAEARSWYKRRFAWGDFSGNSSSAEVETASTYARAIRLGLDPGAWTQMILSIDDSIAADGVFASTDKN